MENQKMVDNKVYVDVIKRLQEINNVLLQALLDNNIKPPTQSMVGIRTSMLSPEYQHYSDTDSDSKSECEPVQDNGKVKEAVKEINKRNGPRRLTTKK